MMIKEIEQTLKIPKKHMESLSVYCDYHAQKYPKRYKYRPESTQCKIRFEKNKWRFIYAIRDYQNKDSNIRFELKLPDAAKEAIIKRFEKF